MEQGFNCGFELEEESVLIIIVYVPTDNKTEEKMNEQHVAVFAAVPVVAPTLLRGVQRFMREDYG